MNDWKTHEYALLRGARSAHVGTPSGISDARIAKFGTNRAGNSVAGTLHQATVRQCEDACGWRADTGVTCLAVADGAGSRPMSRRGAALAVEGSLLASAEGPHAGDPAAWLRLIFAAAREQITTRARTEGKDADDYATTLAVAILTGSAVAVGQIGDTIAVAGRAGSYQTLTPRPEPST